jgi:pre-rRNA-processing protein TSR3
MRFLIIQDHKENRRKCTLAPLAALEGFTFVRVARPPRSGGGDLETIELGAGILLELGAPCLTRADRELVTEGSVVLLDSTWARVPQVLRRLRVRSGARLERRSLPGAVVTAYPRVSKLYQDPPCGLASVEAVYAASLVLGEPRPEVLRDYRWGEEFLRRNRLAFASLGG